MNGKSKCKILKEIRAEIARANDIEWITESCTYKGECRGSCPKCEAEVRKLERALEKRRRLGRSVAIAGISAGLIASAVSCTSENTNGGSTMMTDATEIIEQTDIMGMVTAPADTGEDVLEMGEFPDTEAALMGDYLATEAGTESIFELLGDVVSFLSEDFTRYDAVSYRACESLFVMGFSDVEYTDDTDFSIPAGDLFDVVGECDDYDQYMISYKGQLFGIDKAGFETIAEKV